MPVATIVPPTTIHTSTYELRTFKGAHELCRSPRVIAGDAGIVSTGVHSGQMANDDGLKSAYELAMERFKKKDADAGVERKSLTDAQKAKVADIRSFYQAKLAELEILHTGKLRTLFDPAERELREDEYRRERERLANERDAKIEKARASE